MPFMRNDVARATLMVAVSTVALAGASGALAQQARQFNVPAQAAATAPVAPAMDFAAGNVDFAAAYQPRG